MIVRELEFVRLAVPFRGVFEHARQRRREGDTLLLRIGSTTGLQGWGEILPRPYVTGETVADILEIQGAALADELLGRSFEDSEALVRWLDVASERHAHRLALLGGIELAVLGLLAQGPGVDLDRMVGRPRSRPVGRCVTIGFDAATDELRKRAIDARLKGATVVKLKVGIDPDPEVDAARLRTLSDHLAGRLPLRIDGNGSFTFERARQLLDGCAGLPLESFEQPIGRDVPDLSEQLRDLHRANGVSLMADESVCSMGDARRWVDTGAYQAFNLRVGKHGGLRATARVRDLAQRSGIELVGGAMVGESSILDQASRLLLARSDVLDYVEGLGQSAHWLKVDPAEPVDGDDKAEDADGTMRFRALRFGHERCTDMIRRTHLFR